MMLLLTLVARAEPLAFEAAVREALDHGPGAALAAADRRVALGDATTTGTLLPNPEAALTRDVEGTDAELRLAVPIAGQPVARAAAAGALRQAAELRGDTGEVTAALRAGRAYLDAQRAEELARLAGDTLALAERNRDAARQLLAASEVSAVDAVTLEALAARAVQDATTAQQEALRARLALEVELGRAPTGEATPTGWPDLPVPDRVDPAALPAARIAAEEARASRALRTLTALDRVPTPTVTGGWSVQGGAAGPIVGVELQVPLFAPGVGAVRSAAGEADRSAALARRAALGSAAAWTAATSELEAATAAFESSRIEGLEDALDAIGVALASGEYSLSEYTTRRDALIGGLATAIESRWRLEVARLALWELAGRLPPEVSP